MNRILNGIIVILFSSMLVGCGAENLSEKYNKDELEKLSKEIVTLINEKEYFQWAYPKAKIMICLIEIQRINKESWFKNSTDIKRVMGN